VEIFHPDDPVTVDQPGCELLEDILAQAGDAIMQTGDLSARFLPIL
jgi:hypothetical protein